MSHVHHESLPGYVPEACLQDGCPECEGRAAAGLKGILRLDPDNQERLYRVMLTELYGGGQDEERLTVSSAERQLADTFYLMAVLIEKQGGRPWVGIREAFGQGD